MKNERHREMSEPISRILCTRPLDAALIGKAAGKGIQIDCLSFIETEATVNGSIRDLIGHLSSQPLAAVFTSMNAVEAVGSVLDTAAWKIWCIGSATRKLAGEYFGEERIEGTADSAAALAGVILDDPAFAAGQAGPGGEQGFTPREVFFFCGDQRRDELQELLRQGGVVVNEIVVYRTLPTPHRVDEAYEGMIFFSPSAVHSFFSENRPAAGTVFFAIGNTTAEAIRSYTGNELVIGASPDKEALVGLAIGYFNK